MAKQSKFSAETLRDFRIPVDVFKQNCQPLCKTRAQLQDRVLLAVGITQEKGSKVDWETFLRLKQLFRPSNSDRNQLIDFVVRLFDPKRLGDVTDYQFELAIRHMFCSVTELDHLSEKTFCVDFS